MSDIRDVLLDILKHTASLGIFEQLKVTNNKNTRLDTIDANRTVILEATMHKLVDGFEGEFGMGNLGLLSKLTKLSNYTSDDASLTMLKDERNGESVPSTLLFKDSSGSKDSYRFMSKSVVEKAIKVGKFKGAEWKVEIQPSVTKVEQFAEVSSIYSGVEPSFDVITENNTLVFKVGSTEGGAVGYRVFAENIDGVLNNAWSYNLDAFLKILNLGLTGACVVRFGEGVCQIDIDSGIGIYTYTLPALSL